MDKTYGPTEGYLLVLSYVSLREFEISLIKFSNKKEVELLEKRSFSSLNELDAVELELPCVLVIQGKKVLDKSLEGKSVKEVFPNLNLSDFLVEINESKVRLIRKQDFQELLDSLAFSDKVVGTVFHSEIIGGEALVKKSLESLKREESQAFDVVRNQNESFRFQSLTKKVGIYAMAIFLFLLLMNVLIFDQFSKQKRVLATSLMQNSSVIEELQVLEEELHVKQEFFNNASWMHSTNFSFYASEIGRTVVAGLALDELSINRKDPKNKNKKEVQFEEGVILIKGHCDKSATLNEWKKSVKDLDWVKDIDVRSFDRDSKDGGNFELIIEC